MKVNKMTVARTIILVLALLNQCLVVAGKPIIEIADETIIEAVSLVWTIAASVWAWWKNNSFSQSAMLADAYMESIKRSDT